LGLPRIGGSPMTDCTLVMIGPLPRTGLKGGAVVKEERGIEVEVEGGRVEKVEGEGAR